MIKRYGRGEGVYGINTAPILDSEAAYIPKANRYLTDAANIKSAITANSNTGYYNDKAKVAKTTEAQSVITTEGRDCPSALVAILLGKKINEATGMLFDDGSMGEAPYCATSFHRVYESGARFEQYLKGKWSIEGEESATQKEDIDPKNITLVYTAIVTEYEFDLEAAGAQGYDISTDAFALVANGTKAGLKRLVKEVDQINVPTVHGQWYTAVQVPGTQNADALSLTSVPDHDDIDIAVGSSIVVTSNNPISTIVSVLTDDGVDVPVSVGYSSDRKTVTISPDGDLVNATLLVCAIYAKDVYGQTIKLAVAFTTIA